MYFRKIWAVIGIFITIPYSFTVIGCGINKNKNVISEINEINDLEILISFEEEDETVFNILQHSSLGLAETIYNYKNMFRIFKKELFELDFENVYFDKEKNNRVSKKDKIILDNIYYLQYFYNKKRNNILIPVKVKNSNETLVVKNINKINYKQNIIVNSTIADLKATISSEFISNYLDNNIKEIFINNLFKIQEIKKGNQVLTNYDFKTPTQIEAQIIYTYGLIKNQKTNLIIDIKYTKQQIVDEINNTDYQINVIMKTKVKDFVKKEITKTFIKNNLKNTDIRNVFDENKFKLLLISNDNNALEDNDLIEVKQLKTIIHYKYENIAGQTNLIIDIKYTEQQIVDEINNVRYRYDVYKNVKVKEFIEKIISNKIFIKNGIGDVNIRNIFDEKKFEFHSIKKFNNFIWENSDFKKITSINAKINYTYHGVEGIQQTKLIIYVRSENI